MLNLKIAPLLMLLSVAFVSLEAQIKTSKFGSGINFMASDSSYSLKFGFRFQSLATHSWDFDEGEVSNYEGNALIRRSRLKFSGYAHSPKLTYKLELGLSNRDLGGGSGSEFNRAANMILDASVKWNFHNNMAIQFGQRKLPGNRERIVSSGNLQFVDRSRLNSRFNIDRDMGITLFNHQKLGAKFILKETIAFTQGEGRNVTQGNFGAYSYTGRLEALPMGDFLNDGEYVGSSIVREKTPKLAIAAAYNINYNAVRERGQVGNFLRDSNGNYTGKTLRTLFFDAMLKYEGLSFMFEYADRKVDGDLNTVFENVNGISTEIGQYYTGSGINLSAGYMLRSNWEIAGRYTYINPDKNVGADDRRYTLGLSKFIVGHKLKFQSDLTLIDIVNGDDKLMFRTQVDVHF